MNESLELFLDLTFNAGIVQQLVRDTQRPPFPSPDGVQGCR